MLRIRLVNMLLAPFFFLVLANTVFSLFMLRYLNRTARFLGGDNFHVISQFRQNSQDE